MIEAYKTWLDEERRFLCWEMAADPFFQARYSPVFIEGEVILPIRGPNSDRIAYFAAIKRSWHNVGPAGNYHTGDEPAPST